MARTYTQFRVQRGVAQSRSRQLAAHFRSRIDAGELAYGESLPPADAVRGASRVTVLQAYRQLRDEGLVRMQPSRGTVVIARRRPGSIAILVAGNTLAHGGQMYVNQLIAALMTHAPADWQAPRTYVLRAPAEPTDLCDPYIPDQLREDIVSGVICGAFVHRPRHLPRIFDWLAERNVPAVSLSTGPDVPHLDVDFAGAVGGLLAEYRREGLRRVEVWDTSQEQDVAGRIGRSGEAGVLQGLDVRWRECPVDHVTVIETARGFARALAEAALLPDALIVTDDWVGMTAVHELARLGILIPDSLRVGVLCNYGFIPQILHRCDRVVLDPDEQAAALYDLMSRVVDRRPWRPVLLSFRVSHACLNEKESPV
jgi:DNA-binding LacI/PurR family transcriptional regulator